LTFPYSMCKLNDCLADFIEFFFTARLFVIIATKKHITVFCLWLAWNCFCVSVFNIASCGLSYDGSWYREVHLLP